MVDRTDLLHSIVTVSALGLIGWGCWLAWPPLAPLAIGVLLLAAVIYSRVIVGSGNDQPAATQEKPPG